VTPPSPQRTERKRRTSTAEPHCHAPAPQDCPPRQAGSTPSRPDPGVPPPRAPADEGSEDGEDGERALSQEDREWARRTVAALPPLTSRQRDILAMLLRQRR
jgi:hypothetical protein